MLHTYLSYYLLTYIFTYYIQQIFYITLYYRQSCIFDLITVVLFVFPTTHTVSWTSFVHPHIQRKKTNEHFQFFSFFILATLHFLPVPFQHAGDQPRRGQQKVDSYQRLFGEPERPNTPARNHMKSSIPFGSNTEAAQELLANGNGHHSNGKGGSVSTSTSSSVSSSTENLKMNGVSKLGEQMRL